MLKTFHLPIKKLGVLLVPWCWNLFDIGVTHDQTKISHVVFEHFDLFLQGYEAWENTLDYFFG